MAHAASKIQLFLTPFFNFWQYYAVKMPLIDFGRLNLPIEEKNLQKIHIRIPCSCSAKIEAGYSTEFWRSREPWICNFCQIFLHRFTKCITLKSIFVNNLNLAIVRIPLIKRLFPKNLKNYVFSKKNTLLKIANFDTFSGLAQFWVLTYFHYFGFFWHYFIKIYGGK